MRFLLLAAVLVLPGFCRAQFYGPPVYNSADMALRAIPYGASATFEEGSYVLTNSPTVRQTGQLLPSKADMLTVKGPDKKQHDYTTAEVSFFRIGKKRFVVEKNIKRPNGKVLDRAFVAMLDSGQQVILTQLAYYIEGPSYVARRPQETEAMLISGDNFLPYLAGRPDLIKLYKAGYFSKNYIEKDRMYTIAYALNTGQPYVPPRSHYEILKQQALAKRAQKAAADSAKK